jgi:hypothetical protein
MSSWTANEWSAAGTWFGSIGTIITFGLIFWQHRLARLDALEREFREFFSVLKTNAGRVQYVGHFIKRGIKKKRVADLATLIMRQQGLPAASMSDFVVSMEKNYKITATRIKD